MKMIYLMLFTMALLLMPLIRSGFIESVDDPYGNPEEHNLTTTEYGATWDRSCDGGTCNMILYSGVRNADENGTRIENAKSLKDCQFCDSIKLEIKETIKGQYPVKIIDYNFTSMTLDVQADTSELNKDIPIEIYSIEKVFDEKTQEFIDNKTIYFEDTVNLNSISDKQTFTIPFGFDKVVEWGENSTLLRINLTRTNSGRIWDDYNVGCSGTGFGNQNAVDGDLWIAFSNTVNGIEFRSYLEFNTSIIPDDSTINEAIFWGALVTELMDPIDGENAFVYTCNYGTIENSDFENTVLGHNHGWIFNSTSALAWHSLNLTIDGNNISKTGVSQFCIYSNGTCRDDIDYWIMESTTVSTAPYLNITYTEAPPPPTTAVNCTFPNDYGEPKTINMTWFCNITTESWAKNLNFTDDAGWMNVSSILNVTNITNFLAGQIIYMAKEGRINIKS